MKFLDRNFRDTVSADIDENGVVIVQGIMRRDPVDLLMDEDITYKEAFNEWYINDWAPSREAKLADILKTPTNKQRYCELTKEVERSRVIPFVGSGMSAPSDMPMWKSFLYELQENSNLPLEELDKVLCLGAYEKAASILLNNMPMHLFDERLELVFKALSSDDVLGAVRMLPEIFNGTIVTTNFDNVLEEAYKEIEGHSFQEVLYSTKISDYRKRGRGQRCLLKIHGHHEDSIGRVLTEQEYDNIYGQKSPARTELEYLFGSESLLFLGCSLENDRTMNLLKKVVGNDPHTPRNFAFLKSPSPSKKTEREHFLSDRKIFPIYYDDDHDECIEALLFGLMKAIGRV